MMGAIVSLLASVIALLSDLLSLLTDLPSVLAGLVALFGSQRPARSAFCLGRAIAIDQDGSPRTCGSSHGRPAPRNS